ncbi:AsmA-like C-terminal region-containing protein [Myroides marinus]|uniref:AsmA-like C-terminal region-containing protein n=1 Tax=Myroides marinus TaxID=703342 RepID=UPI002575DBF2|nr:AsmA-like C-terminal region-containing protein [Myroides marinus]MDM1367278.1 AsmA family protein [Myroides marinus]MDM1374507.1 AsmA family protein [Myroides marinus]MDM1381661.1 AsmA family protein [Myroides marinus]
MNKKVLKWIGGVVLGLFLVLMLTPILFKGKIQDLVLKAINDNLNANVTFEKVDLSLLRNFPKATVIIKDIAVVNKEPFAGDTLFYANNIKLKMSVMELFNGEKKPMNIEGILLENAKANIIVNEQGVTNYDIAIKDDDEKDDEEKEDKPFSLALKHYQVNNLNLSYKDLGSKMMFNINELYHQGTGNLAADVLDLDTESKAKISFEKEGSKLLNGVNLSLKAIIGMDMANQVYSFKKNKALINQLPLEFDGSIKLLENGQQYDLTFATPDSDFKNFLGLVPEAYAGNLKGVTTTGDFKITGKVKGEMTDVKVPIMDIKMNATNASFKYPDLPMAVQNIMLDVNVMNTTGLMKDMYVDINKLSFKIAQDVFNAKANIKNISENALVDANFNGVINLSNVAKAYPVKVDVPLSGILKANVSANFDMNSIEKEQYQNIKNSGSASLTGFNFSTEAMAKPMLIQEAALTFNTSNVTLNKLSLKTGSTDLAADGRLDNLYGFLFNKQTLKGNFNLKSNNFLLADLLKEDTTKPEDKKEKASTAKATEPLKIPGFLDCTINANANTVVYDNLTLKNVKGKLIIKDEAARLENMSTNVFGGTMAFGGNVSTKETIPTFNMNLGMQSLDIKQTFTELGFLKAIAPIAGVMTGKINATVDMSGKLKAADLSPELNTLSGDIKGDLSNAVISAQNSKLLSSLDGALNFIDMKNIDLSNKKMHIVFNNGRVQFKPFDIKSKDIAVTVSGEHGFDQSLNYSLDFKVPAKLLGSDVANALALLGPKSSDKFDAIPVKVGVTGHFANPKVSANMAEVVKNLTNQIVDEQKNQLVDKGKDALIDLLGGKKDKTGETTDPAKKNETEETVNKISEGLKGLFGKKKKEEEAQ